MPPSIHDNLLISYEVQCEARAIVFHTEYRVPDRPTELVTLSFEGVQGYHFKNDAFGNIIFSVDTVPLEELLAELAAEISESYREAGAPGPWAANLERAPEHLGGLGIKGFVLSSSHGMSGWMLAKQMTISEAHGERRQP